MFDWGNMHDNVAKKFSSLNPNFWNIRLYDTAFFFNFSQPLSEFQKEMSNLFHSCKNCPMSIKLHRLIVSSL